MKQSTVSEFREWAVNSDPGDKFIYFVGITPIKQSPLFKAALNAYRAGEIELFQRQIGWRKKVGIYSYEAQKISKATAKKLDKKDFLLFDRAQMHEINTTLRTADMKVSV